MNDKYLHPRWQEKRNEILERDNFTCQNVNCSTFDPSKGMVHIVNPMTKADEIHWYNNNHQSEYTIDQADCAQYTIVFPYDTYIKMPVLQVHHKRYIKDHELWEYDNKDLVTVCKKCH